MSEAREALATLRDIREPPPPEGSPPWLPLAVLLLAALVAALVARRLRRRRRAWLEEARAALVAARAAAPPAALVALAGTLRRVMRHRHGTAVDALDGEAWLARLDEEFATDWFTRGAGRVFGDALYAPGSATRADVAALADALAGLLERLPPPRERRRARRGAGATAAESAAALADGRPAERTR